MLRISKLASRLQIPPASYSGRQYSINEGYVILAPIDSAPHLRQLYSVLGDLHGVVDQQDYEALLAVTVGVTVEQGVQTLSLAFKLHRRIHEAWRYVAIRAECISIRSYCFACYETALTRLSGAALQNGAVLAGRERRSLRRDGGHARRRNRGWSNRRGGSHPIGSIDNDPRWPRVIAEEKRRREQGHSSDSA